MTLNCANWCIFVFSFCVFFSWDPDASFLAVGWTCASMFNNFIVLHFSSPYANWALYLTLCSSDLLLLWILSLTSSQGFFPSQTKPVRKQTDFMFSHRCHVFKSSTFTSTLLKQRTSCMEGFLRSINKASPLRKWQRKEQMTKFRLLNVVDALSVADVHSFFIILR